MLATLALLAAAHPAPFAALPASAPLAHPTLPAAHGGAFPPPPPPPPPPGAGGTWNGPGDTVGGGSSPGPGGPGAPGPSGPSSPGPSTPGAPAPAGPCPAPSSAGPSSPSTPGPARPSTPGPGGTGPNDLHWSHWWHLERDAYLRLRERVRATREEASDRTVLIDRPGIPASRATIEAEVLPALVRILRAERSDDIVTASLIAVARIGADGDAELAQQLVTALSGQLRASSQEVSETATLALGILADPAAIAPLTEIALGTEDGARLVGRGRVPDRTRAFAAMGLGLSAIDIEGAPERQRIALTLVEILEQDHATDDIPVAATIAIGLCPAPLRLTVPDPELRSHENALAVLSRSNQVRWLVDRLDRRKVKGRARGPAARAHTCTAIARLSGDLPDADRTRALEALENCASSSAEPVPVRSGALVAIGELARCGSAAADASARRVLLRTLSDGQAIERRYASIALAASGSRPGGGDEPLAGAKEARRTLLHRLARARSGDRPWAALSLGVHAYAMRELGSPDADRAGRELVTALRKQRNSSDVGAYALGCALTCERSKEGLRKAAGKAALASLDRMSDPIARGHIALALGMLGHEDAIDDLRKLARKASFQPALLWSCAVGLGLLEDETVTPMLVDAVERGRSAASRAAAASALGHVGDRRAVAPLLKLAVDDGAASQGRAFAIVGLGVVCDPHPLPWRTPIAHALPYVALTSTLAGGTKGVLEIL